VTISADGEQVAYSPAAGFAGIETFSYVLADPRGRTATAEVVVEVVPSWQNVHYPLDVNSDTFVSAIDALLIINYLNAGHPSHPAGAPSGPPFWDVTGDGSIAPLDALLVINYLNRQSRGEGEPVLGAPAAVRVTAGLAGGVGAAGEAAGGSWLVGGSVAGTFTAPARRAELTRPRAAAAPAEPALSWSEAGLRRPIPAAGLHRVRETDVLPPWQAALRWDDLCELLAAARHAEPRGG
jgi:hypothetical protein